MVVAGVEARPDADLLAAAADGDEHASEELFRRHHTAVLRYARGLVRDQHLAEDLTSEAFTRTFAAMRQGHGPRDACRPYLYTVVRNTATDWARGDRRTVVTDEVADWASAPEDDPPPDVDELDALVRAFRSLPERWQTVLWYTVIEDEPIAQVAELLGMEKGAVSQLSFRAREGLRQAFLAASAGGRPECAEFTAELAANVRRPGRRRTRALRRHLESCDECRRASKEMTDLNGRLRRALPIGAVLLGAPSAPFSPLAPLGSAASGAGWALPIAVAGGIATGLAIILFSTGGDGAQAPPEAIRPSAVPAPQTSAAPQDVHRSDYAAATQTPGRGGTAPGAGATPGAASGAGPYRVRNTTLQSCLAPSGTAVVQRSCSDSTTGWKRENTGGGFTLTSSSTGQCMARGEASAGVPWEGGSEYSVVMAPCGGAHQVWTMAQTAPSVYRLSNGEGYYLQASWSGLKPVSLKPASYAGMAAQGWAIEGTR
ncbi:sigma-70 family RNA polymerase sigma factor [Actinomadura geliboluensis]|uniref:sigma-70 family RNA polymerase sigma factor n=1 Tax=Actinomadura geliboluensis TaxID=882440 RepID=UPI0026069727|nr:sigma-70 family RNA polymerase sigma factor [Actinomadura geliboluensis]